MKIKSGDIQDNFNDKPVKTEKHMWIGWILSAILLFLFILLGLGLKNPVVHILHGDFDYYYELAQKNQDVIDAFICISPTIYKKLNQVLEKRQIN